MTRRPSLSMSRRRLAGGPGALHLSPARSSTLPGFAWIDAATATTKDGILAPLYVSARWLAWRPVSAWLALTPLRLRSHMHARPRLTLPRRRAHVSTGPSWTGPRLDSPTTVGADARVIGIKVAADHFIVMALAAARTGRRARPFSARPIDAGPAAAHVVVMDTAVHSVVTVQGGIVYPAADHPAIGPDMGVAVVYIDALSTDARTVTMHPASTRRPTVIEDVAPEPSAIIDQPRSERKAETKRDHRPYMGAWVEGEHQRGVVYRHVEQVWMDGPKSNITVCHDDFHLRRGDQIAGVARLGAQSLRRGHDIGRLRDVGLSQ